jgi:CRP-like cAMP-binding protein
MPSRLELNGAEIASLMACGKPRRYRSGELLFGEGDRSDHVVVIRRGTVKIWSVSNEGYEAVLAVRTSGDIVGEFAALDRRPRSASVVAIDDVDGVLVTGEQFRSFLRTHPSAAMAMLSSVVARLREADRRRLEFGAHDVTGRVARLLLELVDTYGSPTVDGAGTAIDIPLSQQELAGATGSSREAVSRALRRLRESNAVRTGRRRIVVLNIDVLRGFSAPTPDGSGDG